MSGTLATIAACLVGLIVFFDARRIGMSYGWGPGNKPRFGAAGWAMCCTVMPAIFLPGYIVQRLRFVKYTSSGPMIAQDKAELPDRDGR